MDNNLEFSIEATFVFKTNAFSAAGFDLVFKEYLPLLWKHKVTAVVSFSTRAIVTEVNAFESGFESTISVLRGIDLWDSELKNT
ncbi:Hypothetical predicted protein [Octopus vulgaris]|uniref:Uncharacterized protein n=1 Tax=Octopus vulgaris TaxID=6645 RepID=A0AA36B1R3_OCTVU|nr:Hypothetical predicted protein [Octopus vulgaris]